MGYEEALQAAHDGAISIEEATKFLGLGRTVVYGHMNTGRLRFVKVGARRLILRSELRRFLAECLTANAAG